MMKLSKMPFMALVSLFLLTNILTTAFIITSAPPLSSDKPYSNIIKKYWNESDAVKQHAILRGLYPEIQKDFPELVHTHKFYSDNDNKNMLTGKQAFSELTLGMFSFYQYAKRKNWQTITRMSYQSLQQYGASLERYITDKKFNIRKVMRYNNEMKNLIRSSRINTLDKKIVFAKIDSLNKNLNRAEIYAGERQSLNKIKSELNNDLGQLSNFSRSVSGLNYIDQLTKISASTAELLVAQYIVSGFILFIMLSLFQTNNVTQKTKLEDSALPVAHLNKKGQFLQVNDSLKGLLPFKKFNLIKNLNWGSFEKLASVDLKTPIEEIKAPLITSGSFTQNDIKNNFLIRIAPNQTTGGYTLNLVDSVEIENFQEINDLPAFNPPEVNEDLHLSYILEDVVAELSNLFQSKQVELNLKLKGEKHVLTGNVEKTHLALKTFIRDMVLALSPRSRTKQFNLTLENTIDGLSLRADMNDVKLATPILKSNFKFEEAGKIKKRSLNQGIDVLKNSGLGFDIDLNFGNNFDINNKFIGSNISIEMRN